MHFGNKLRNYFEKRRAVRELEALDDRTLSDLGVSRHNLRAAVEGRR